jgi:hypothetical protein
MFLKNMNDPKQGNKMEGDDFYHGDNHFSKRRSESKKRPRKD